MSNGPPALSECNCFAVRKAARQISRFYDAKLHPTGLRVTQFLILATLERIGEAAINDLAERLDIERTAMGKMLVTLERDGLLGIRPSPDDGRSRIAVITEAGRSRLGVATPLWHEAQALFERANGPGVFDTLRRGFTIPGNGPELDRV